MFCKIKVDEVIMIFLFIRAKRNVVLKGKVTTETLKIVFGTEKY